MTNINDYKKRFYNLMESTMGDSKPLINEEVDQDLGITTALQGVATYYNNTLTNFYTKNPNKPRIYFSVKRSAGFKDAEGVYRDFVWYPYFGNKILYNNGVGTKQIYDQDFKPKLNMQYSINVGVIDPIMNKMGNIDGITTRVNTTPSDTAVAAITATLKAQNPTRP